MSGYEELERRLLDCIDRRARHRFSGRHPTFPVLHEKAAAVPAGAVPSMHPSDIRSRRAPCSPATASTKSPSCWDTATPRLPGSSTSTRLPTLVAEACGAPG
jgi:hypothetical protein